MIKLRLKEILDDYGFTQKQLAELTKIKEATISSYCNNSAKNISIDNVNRICITLGCEINDFFQFIDVKDTQFPDSDVYMTYQEYQRKLKNSDNVVIDDEVLQAMKDGNMDIIKEYIIQISYRNPERSKVMIDKINSDGKIID